MIDKSNRWGRGRGYRKFFYTVETIAKIKEITPKSVRKAQHRGIFDMSNLESVATYLGKNSGRPPKKEKITAKWLMENIHGDMTWEQMAQKINEKVN